MANKFEAQRQFNGHSPIVIDAIVRAVQSLGWNLQAARPEIGRVAARTALTAMSFGEQLTIDITQGSLSPTTSVSARSQLPWGLVDFGRNRKHVEKLFAAVDAQLPGVSVTPPSWSLDPSGRHELRYWDGTRWTSDVSDSGVTSVDHLT